jgi:2,5-diamino-6-(ribosylamino)-4(3H)-pyrimidinone 5'-phosphate reductase
MPTKKPSSKKKKTTSKITPSRPETTLFLVMSVDGRITSHDSDDIDPNKSWKHDPRIAALTQPFVDFGTGNVHSLTYGEAMNKVGINTRTGKTKRLPIKLIVIDDLSHLTARGVSYLAQNCRTLFFACDHKHPALALKSKPKNLHLLVYTTSYKLKNAPA